MAKYLITKTTYFVDPHGSVDEGGIEKFIATHDAWKKVKSKYYYREGLDDDTFKYLEKEGESIDEFLDESKETEDDLQGSEDGYNAETMGYKVKKITDEQAIEYEAIIKAYNKLK